MRVREWRTIETQSIISTSMIASMVGIVWVESDDKGNTLATDNQTYLGLRLRVVFHSLITHPKQQRDTFQETHSMSWRYISQMTLVYRWWHLCAMSYFLSAWSASEWIFSTPFSIHSRFQRLFPYIYTTGPLVGPTDNNISQQMYTTEPNMQFGYRKVRVFCAILQSLW